MKRQIMKSLMALCAGAMTLCAASSLFTSCDKFDDTQLKQEIESLKGELSGLDARVKVIEELKATLETLTAKVDALYTLKFQVTDKNELQYSFDNGTTWKTTGIILAEECDAPCECPEVSLVDNGDSVTITVGDDSFTIEKPEEIVFELKAGKLYFESEGIKNVIIKSSGIEDITVISAPKGWFAEINTDGQVEITAPDYAGVLLIDPDYGDVIQEGNCAASGYVKVHACGEDGKCMVGKLYVEVTDEPIMVSAWGGKYEVVTTANTVYFGASLRENLKADAQKMFEAYYNRENTGYRPEWDNAVYPDEEPATGDIATLIGSDLEPGKEYVIWAIDQQTLYDKEPNVTVDDLFMAFYTPALVVVAEDETKRTPYDVLVSVDVKTTDSYLAMAVDKADAEYYVETILDELAPSDVGGSGGWFPMPEVRAVKSGWAKLHNKPYVGSLKLIGIESAYFEPNSEYALIILPIDGRPNDKYTKEDFVIKNYKTAELLDGGTISATGEEITSYEVEGQVIAFDPYSELAVKFNASTDNWTYVYFQWFTAAQYETYKADVVAAVLNANGVNNYSKEEAISRQFNGIESSQYKLTLLPEDEAVFVAFFVDENYRYGTPLILELDTEAVTYSDLTLTATTNVNDEGILMNTKALEVSVIPSAEVSKYRYILEDITYDNGKYYDKTAAEMAEILFLADQYTYDGEILPAAIKDGKFTLKKNAYGYDLHSYGSYYRLIILPYDASGKPADEANIFEYEVQYVLPDLIETLTVEPKITFVMPKYGAKDDDGNDVGLYRYDSDWGASYYYEGSYIVEPAEGTTVLTNMVNPEEQDLGTTNKERATGLWAGTFNSSYTNTFTEKGTVKATFNSSTTTAIAPVILVSWKDADNNYYYKEIDLTEEFKAMFDVLSYNGTPAEVSTVPSEKQWTFVAIDEQAFIPAGTKAVLDFGVSTPGTFVLGNESPTQAGTYMNSMGMMGAITSKVEPISATAGIVTLMGVIGFDEKDEPILGEMDKAYYYGLTDTSCSFVGNMIGFIPEATAANVTFATGGGMLP